jgi:hypothetical protein
MLLLPLLGVRLLSQMRTPHRLALPHAPASPCRAVPDLLIVYEAHMEGRLLLLPGSDEIVKIERDLARCCLCCCPEGRRAACGPADSLAGCE